MPKINTPASGHVGPNPNSGRQWNPYVDKDYLLTIQRAVQIIDTRIKAHKSCNNAFKALPGGERSTKFGPTRQYGSAWIGGQANRYGATLHKEITISAYAVRMGRWTVAATLVHELAHMNGAGGTNTARKTLSRVACSKVCIIRRSSAGSYGAARADWLDRGIRETLRQLASQKYRGVIHVR